MPSYVIIIILSREIGISAVPNGHNEKKEFEVFNFTGAGGVALSMYNTDEVQISINACSYPLLPLILAPTLKLTCRKSFFDVVFIFHFFALITVYSCFC